jgi:hypothetical protein
MPYGDIIIKNPGLEGHFLWKYLNLHKLIYFISRRSLFFTRLDFFTDPLEGLKTSTLRKTFTFKDSPESGNVSLPEKRSRAADYAQRKQFVNSWFYGERENMAMWSLYSNSDSVAIRVDLNLVYGELLSSFENAVKEHSRRISIVGDRISYFKLNPFDPRQRIHLRYSALKKDLSFEHEKEYRFLIYASPSYARRNHLTFAVKLDNFARLPFEVITHPMMEDWKRENISDLLRRYEVNFRLQPSDILLRRR